MIVSPQPTSRFRLASRAPRGTTYVGAPLEWEAPVHCESIVVASSMFEEGSIEHDVQELTPVVTSG